MVLARPRHGQGLAPRGAQHGGADAVVAQVPTDPAHREKLETLNGVHSNAAGFKRWLETRSPGPEVGIDHAG